MVATFTVDSREAGTEVGRPVGLLQRDGGASEGGEKWSDSGYVAGQT